MQKHFYFYYLHYLYIISTLSTLSTHLVGVENSHLQQVIRALVNHREVGVVLSVPLQMHHRGNHVD